jgi:hypothetical protein
MSAHKGKVGTRADHDCCYSEHQAHHPEIGDGQLSVMESGERVDLGPPDYSQFLDWYEDATKLVTPRREWRRAG